MVHKVHIFLPSVLSFPSSTIQVHRATPVNSSLSNQVHVSMNGIPESLKRCLQLRFDFDSTAIRTRYDHSTTFVTTHDRAAAQCPK